MAVSILASVSGAGLHDVLLPPPNIEGLSSLTSQLHWELSEAIRVQSCRAVILGKILQATSCTACRACLSRISAQVLLTHTHSYYSISALTRSFVNQNRSTASMRPRPSSESGMLHVSLSSCAAVKIPRHRPNECFRSVKVIPVLCHRINIVDSLIYGTIQRRVSLHTEVWGRLQKLCR